MLLSKDGESFEFNVAICCGFIKVEKCGYFGLLKSFLKNYKFASFVNSQIKTKFKKLVQANIL